MTQAKQSFREHVLQEGARRWVRAGTEVLRWRQARVYMHVLVRACVRLGSGYVYVFCGVLGTRSDIHGNAAVQEGGLSGLPAAYC